MNSLPWLRGPNPRGAGEPPAVLASQLGKTGKLWLDSPLLHPGQATTCNFELQTSSLSLPDDPGEVRAAASLSISSAQSHEIPKGHNPPPPLAHFVDRNTDAGMQESPEAIYLSCTGTPCWALDRLQWQLATDIQSLAMPPFERGWRSLDPGRHLLEEFLSVVDGKVHLHSHVYPSGGTRYRTSTRIRSRPTFASWRRSEAESPFWGSE